MIKIWKLAATNFIHILNVQVNILRYLFKKTVIFFSKSTLKIQDIMR